MSDEQTQPGAPDATPAGVDPATTDPAAGSPSVFYPPSAAASPSTVASGEEHAAAPALDPGQAPQTASPASVSAMPSDAGYVSSRALLTVGAAGDEVAELGYLLAAHGFENAISQGQAAAPPILDDALMRTVVDFQQKNGIDPYAAEGDDPNARAALPRDHGGIVEARTWAALLGYEPKQVAAGSQIAEGVGGSSS